VAVDEVTPGVVDEVVETGVFETGVFETGEADERGPAEVGEAVDTEDTVPGKVEDVGVKDIDMEADVADGEVEVPPEACRFMTSAARRTSSRTP